MHAFNKGMRLRDSTCELRVQLPTTEVYLIYLLVAGKDLNHKRLGEYLHDLKLWKRKKELAGRQFWRAPHGFLKLSSSQICSWGALGSKLIIFGWVLMFFFPNLIFLISTLPTGFAATLWLQGATHTESLDVHVKSSGLFCKPLCINSSMANRTPPMWLHFLFPCSPRPGGEVQAACRTSSRRELDNNFVFFIEGRTFAFT